MEKRYLIQMTISFLTGSFLTGLTAILGTWTPSQPWYFLGSLVVGGAVFSILTPYF